MGSGQVGQIAGGQGGFGDVRQRGQQLRPGRLYAGHQGILKGLAGEILLGYRRQHKLQELLGVFQVFPGGQDAGAGYHYDSPRPAAAGMVIPRRKVVSRLGQEPEQVVVVDKADIDFPGGGGGDLGGVLGINPGVVGLDALQPLAGSGLAPLRAHRRYHGLERGVGRGPADAVFPNRVGKAEHIIGQVGFGQPVGIINYRPRAAGNAHPLALRRPGPFRHLLQDGGGQRRKHSLYRAQAAGILGKENIRRRVGPFLQQGSRQLRRAGVLYLHLNAGNIPELADDAVHQGLAAPGVNHQFPRVGRPFHDHLLGNLSDHFLRHYHLFRHFPHHFPLDHYVHRDFPDYLFLDHHLPGDFLDHLLLHHHLFFHHLGRRRRRRAAGQQGQQPYEEQGHSQVPVKPANPRHNFLDLLTVKSVPGCPARELEYPNLREGMARPPSPPGEENGKEKRTRPDA